MEIKEFVANYNNQTDEDKRKQMIDDRIKTYYMPYTQKIDLCSASVKIAYYKDDKFIEDTPMLMFLVIGKSISTYTDLKFDKKNPVEDFDLLEKNGITGKIIREIGDDYNSLKSVLDMVIEDTKSKENNFVGLLKDSVNDFYRIVNSDDFKNQLKNSFNVNGDRRE